MKLLATVFLFASAIHAAEALNGFMLPLVANSTAGYSNLPQGTIEMTCLDEHNLSNNGAWVIGVWLDDPTMTSANHTLIAQTGESIAVQYTTGRVLGSIDPNDGNQHQYYAKCISKANPGAGDFPLLASPMPYRFVNGNIAPAYTPNNSAVAGRLTAAQLAIFANTADTYSAGAGGTVICASGKTATGKAPIYLNGAAGYYANARGVPCSNIYEISLPVAPSVTQAQLTAAVSGLFTNGRLANTKIQAIALGWVEPANVVPTGVSLYELGICGVMALGNTYLAANTAYNTSGDAMAGTFATQNPYFNAVYTPTPATTYGVYPTMMLAAEACPSCNSNLTGPWSPSAPAFQAAMSRTTAADSTNPTGLHCSSSITTDTGYGALTALISPNSVGSGMSDKCSTSLLGTWSNPVDTSALHNQTGNLYYIQGSWRATLPAGGFAPGAGIGVMFSSFGGDLPSGAGQAVAPLLLNLGAAAAYGSSYEPGPVDLMRKYPSMELVVPFYTAGMTAVEALWRGTALPWMGTFAGDPLAAPYTFSPLKPGTLVSSVSVLGFRYVVGGAVPPAQNIALDSTGAPLGYTATASASWVTVTPVNGSTPRTLSVTVNPKGLVTGLHAATIQITPTSGGAPIPVTVQLAVR